MATVHLTREDGWQPCATEVTCAEVCHLHDTTVEAAAQLPIAFLEKLLGALDPPAVSKLLHSADLITADGKHWGRPTLFHYWHDSEGRKHRDYGLPAVIREADGKREYWQHGRLARPHGLPVIEPGRALP